MANRPAAARHCNAGFELFQKGETAKALAEFDQAIRQDDSLAEAHWLRVLTLGRLRRAEEAAEAGAALRRRFPDNPDVCQAHSEVLLQLGRGEELQRAVTDGLQLS